MMAPFRHTVEALVNPYFLCLFVYTITFIVFCFVGNRFLIRISFAGILLLFLLISTGWLPKYLTEKIENQYPAIQSVNPDIRWVVVLSGGQAAINDLPSHALLYKASIKRLLEGIRLFKQLPEAKLLLSGGGYGQDKPESSHLQDVAQMFSISEQRIQLELNSINTADQAREIKKIVGDAPFYLVTSAIHMTRSMALCQKQGLHPIAAPTDFTVYWYDERWQKTWLPNARNIVFLDIALHELYGILWARINSQI